MKRFILVQQVVIPDYRLPFFKLMRDAYGEHFQMVAGDEDFNKTPRSTPEAWGYFRRTDNVYVLKRRFLWQRNIVSPVLRCDVFIGNANLRNLSIILCLILRKLCRKKSFLWGHASGQVLEGNLARGLFFRLTDGFISYTHSQAGELRSRYPWLKVYTAPNACMHANDCFSDPVGADQVNTVLYVGRLVAEKKPELLLRGFHQAAQNGRIPKCAKLVFIGEGPESDRLKSEAEKLNICDRVDFPGHIADIPILRRHYSKAVCSVSPGYVGLSATQSFGFGVPMLVARDEFHSPEIEACREGFNAAFFSFDDPAALASGLGNFFMEKHTWIAKRKQISDWTRDHYTFESMREAFIEAIDRLIL